MSTKTTFKRVALVAVAALGFGLMGPVSANAAGPSTMTVPVTDVTLIGSTYGFVAINVFDADGIASALDTGESITALVTDTPKGVEATTATSDLVFALAKRVANSTTGVSTWSDVSGGTFASAADTAGTFSIQAGAGIAGTTTVATQKSGTYNLAIKAASGKAVDKGTYTVRIRLTDSTGFVTQQNVSVRIVTSAADSGAVITLASAGTFVAGETVTMTATQSVKATLRNATGGRIQNTGGLTNGPGAPTLTAALWAGTTPAIVGATSNWYVSDTGTQVTTPGYAGDFYSATAVDSATVFAQAVDGVYGIGHVSGLGTGLGVTQLSVSPYFRVTYGATAATLAITVRNAIGGTAVAPVFTGVGVAAINAANTFNLPLTTKTASFSVGGAVAGNTYSYTVAYTNVSAGDQTPLAATATAVIADSAGFITVPVTVANPVDGAVAVVTISGFAVSTAVPAQTINWVRSKAATLSVDMSGAVVALKSTNVFTATVTDTFGAPVSGVLLQPSLSSTGSNGSATLVLPTVTTDASGKATYSLTDALAVAAGTDTVTFTGVGVTITAKSSTITYAATAPAPTALTAYYSSTPLASSVDAAIRVVAPATGVYRTGTTAFSIQKARNNSTVTSVVDTTGDQVRVVISAGVAGAAVKATASAGAYVLSSASLQSSSRTQYTGTTGFTPSFVIGSNKTGANTVTFTSGTATTTVAFWVENTGNDARFVKLSQATAGGAVVAAVTDRYGNGVSGASVQISTSAGTLGNGQMTTVYTTDLSGNVAVLPVGSDAATITAIATNASAEHSASAGLAASSVQIDTTVAAGNSTATLAITPAASATDVAQGATDAAAEATDAANAATDAANAAAEAADAATAAAQDAADAVAALSTQVSEMVNALKKQITALTNLVIKIQKKVKA
jgi:hypothetical protein